MATESDSSVSSDEIDWLGENCGVYEDIVDCLIETTDEKPQSPVVCVDTDNDNNNHIAENYLTNEAESPPKNKRSAEDEKTVAQKKGKREVSYNKFWETKYSVIKGNSKHMAKCILCECQKY